MNSPLADALTYLTSPQSWAGPSGLLHRLLEHLWISLAALLLAAVLAIPIAVWLGHRRRGGTLLIQTGNVARAVPTFAVLVLFVLMPSPFGASTFSYIVGLALFCLPPLLTNTYVGVSEVDRDVVDAGRGMGMSDGELLTKVELPLALPLILTGVRLAVVQVIATATVLGMVGGGALGRTIVAGFETQNQGMVIGGAIVVAVLALAAEGLGELVETLLGRRTRRSRPAGQSTPRRKEPARS